MPVDLKKWLRGVRGKQEQEVYVDFAAIPEQPEGPYRAREAKATHERVPPGIDVKEREVVTGELQVLYLVRCPCGHKWSSLEFQKMSICPQCDRAVLVGEPAPPGP